MKSDFYCKFSRGGPHRKFLPLPLQDQEEHAKKLESKAKNSKRFLIGVWGSLALSNVMNASFLLAKLLKETS